MNAHADVIWTKLERTIASNFAYQKKHVLFSGYTEMGIQPSQSSPLATITFLVRVYPTVALGT